MGYRQHWRAATEVDVQHGTTDDILDALGGEEEGTPGVHLVLNDRFNQEAFVLTGTPDELIDWAARTLQVATLIKDPRPRPDDTEVDTEEERSDADEQPKTTDRVGDTDETVDENGRWHLRGRCDTCGAPCNENTGECTGTPSHVTAVA